MSNNPSDIKATTLYSLSSCNESIKNNLSTATVSIVNAPNRIRLEWIKPPIVSPITAYMAHNRLSDKSLAFSLVFSAKDVLSK